MANNDVWVRLEDIADITSGGTPSKAREDYWIGDIPWVSAKDLKTPRLFDAEDHISEEGLKNGTRLAPAGATLILTRGMTLISDVPTCIAERDLAFNQDLKALVAKKGVDSRYLNYAVLAAKPTLLAAVELAGHGTGRLPTDRLKSLQIWLPPENDQRRIAHVLGTLDDKIELNRQLNATLEALARALFQSWFVAFDPVRAKLSGEPEAETCRRLGLTPEVLALFPDELEESALGEIPKGWAVKPLGQLLELAYGKALKEENRQVGSVAVYGSKGRVGWHNERLVSGPGIVVGRKGNAGAVTWAPEDFFPIDTTFYVVPREQSTSLHFLLFSLEMHNLQALGADSAVPGLNRNIVYASKQLLPDATILSSFEEQVAPIFLQIHQLNEESRTLAALRDELLPKLLSGEVRLA